MMFDPTVYTRSCRNGPFCEVSDRADRAVSLALENMASRDVDHVFARGFAAQSPPRLLERTVTAGSTRVELSDHVPILVELAAATTPPGAGPQTSR